MPRILLPSGHVEIPCPTGAVSDGYHSFDELYAHRGLLFLALQKAFPDRAWCARAHADGSMFDGGWFLAGLDLPTGTVTYHFPIEFWDLACRHARVLERAPAWDGHTSADVARRLRGWLEAP